MFINILIYDDLAREDTFSTLGFVVNSINGSIAFKSEGDTPLTPPTQKKRKKGKRKNTGRLDNIYWFSLCNQQCISLFKTNMYGSKLKLARQDINITLPVLDLITC